MKNIRENIRENIFNAVSTAIEKCGYDNVSFNVETPRETANGDFSVNAAMILCRSAKKAPRVIADELVANIDSVMYVDRVEVAGAGFINFYLNNDWLYDVLKVVEDNKENYGRVDLGKGQKVMVEFVSANPTGPMHMGNARGGALGDAIANVLDFAGYDVTKEFYLNDAGNQIEKFGMSLEARYLQKCGQNVEFSEEWYQGADIIERAEQFYEQYGDKFVSAESVDRRKALVDFSLPKNVDSMVETLSGYRVNYDVWFKESELYKSGEIEETIELLKKSGNTYEKEGALWLKSGEEDEKDDVLVRANGIPTYFAADIAYHINKFNKRGFDKVIDVWGADHHGHVARMKKALASAGIDSEKLVVVLMQLVRLMRGGEVARMSKRSGKAITLNDLIDEIGVDAARFFFNMRNAGSHFDFDLDLAVQQSNDNPVFYVQYAHARICSIIRLLAEDGINVENSEKIDLSVLKEKEELSLIKRISEFPDEIMVAAQTLEPLRMTKYAEDLATDFHSFYNACRCKVDDRMLCLARLKLVDCARIALANVLKILAVSAPEKM